MRRQLTNRFWSLWLSLIHIFGEMTIDDALDPILKDLPGDIYTLLDTEKVGAYIREKENGVFTSKGYCYRVSDQWQEVYDGKDVYKRQDLTETGLIRWAKRH